MKIYTSYFGNAKMLKDNDIIIVGICCYPPKNLKYNIKEVAPTPEILDLRNSRNNYITAYNKMILFTDIANFLNKIEQISQENDGKDIALCCYEKPGDFCHRHLFADFLNKWVPNMDCHEFSAKDTFKKMKTIELF